jgi:hypothetical protein
MRRKKKSPDVVAHECQSGSFTVKVMNLSGEGRRFPNRPVEERNVQCIQVTVLQSGKSDR